MQHYAKHMAGGSKQDLTVEEQRKAGQPVAGAVGDEHKAHFEAFIALMESGEINVDEPKSFLKMEVYESLTPEQQDQIDLKLTNLASQLQQIKKFHDDPSFPDDSPQLETMIEQVWQQKQTIEEHYDVFKF